MITTDLQPVSTLPLHTRMETAVGLGFDVLNGRRGDLEIRPDMSLKDIDIDDWSHGCHGTNRIFKARICDTAKEVREAVELMFGSSVFQRGYSKLRIVNGSADGRIIVMNVVR